MITTQFQETCLHVLRSLAEEWQVPFEILGYNQYQHDAGVSINVGRVPLEVTSTQVDICTPYNGRSFERASYENDQQLLGDLIETTGLFLADPNMERHPFIRFGKWL